MSLITLLTEQVAALTKRLNAITLNAKKNEELPVQEILDPNSIIRVSKAGVSQGLRIEKIINSIVSGNYDKLISIGEITKTGNQLFIPAGASALINNVLYTTSGITTITVPLCAAGLSRTDILVFNTLSQIVRVAGNETSGIIIQPNVPLNTVFVTSFKVTNTDITSPIPVITGENFIEKFEKQEQELSGTGSVNVFIQDKTACINITGGVTEITGVLFSNGGLDTYDGKEYVFRNTTAVNVLLKHNTGSQVKFMFPNNVDFILKPNEQIVYKLRKRAGTVLEYVGVITAQADLTISNATFKVLTATDVQGAFNQTDVALLNARSTGIKSGGAISSLGSGIVRIALGNGEILDNTNPNSPIYTAVIWAQTDINLSSLGTNLAYVFVNSVGTVTFSTTLPTSAERRLNIYLHRVSIIGGLFSASGSIANPLQQYGQGIADVFEALGLVKTSLLVSANGTNLSLNVSSGSIYQSGANFQTSAIDPNKVPYTAKTPATIRLFTRNNTQGTDRTTLDVTNYDLNGTVTPIGGSVSRAQIWTVLQFPTAVGEIRIAYGQSFYASISAAQTALNSGLYNPILPSQKAGAIILGYIITAANATNLNDGIQIFVNTNRFGLLGGAISSLGSTPLLAANNLSDLTDPSTARNNLGILKIKFNLSKQIRYVASVANNWQKQSFLHFGDYQNGLFNTDTGQTNKNLVLTSFDTLCYRVPITCKIKNIDMPLIGGVNDGFLILKSSDNVGTNRVEVYSKEIGSTYSNPVNGNSTVINEGDYLHFYFARSVSNQGFGFLNITFEEV